MPLNLFALTSNPENRIVRFALSQEVQDELTQYITSQEQDFKASIEQEIPFDGKYKPDFGEALVIQNYDDIDGLDQAVKNPLGVADVEPSATTFESIKALFTGHVAQNGKATILIQHFDKRKIISTNGLSIFHSANVYKKIEGIGVTIDSKLSAILEDGNLKFFSFHLLRQVFDLSEYYKEATDNDIKDFASNPLIKVENLDQLVELSDSWIRRKVSLIQQSQILESVPINDFKAVASEFNIPLDTVIDGGSEVIKLPTNKAALKTILRFLDEDYYKSPLSKVQYITNSKRKA
jgi:hypothetical protein